MKSIRGPRKVRTLEDAHRFVTAVGICTIFADRTGKLASLWDAVDLPEKKKGEKGWGQKISAVWSWKTLLPTDYRMTYFTEKSAAARPC